MKYRSRKFSLSFGKPQWLITFFYTTLLQTKVMITLSVRANERVGPGTVWTEFILAAGLILYRLVPTPTSPTHTLSVNLTLHFYPHLLSSEAICEFPGHARWPPLELRNKSEKEDAAWLDKLKVELLEFPDWRWYRCLWWDCESISVLVPR